MKIKTNIWMIFIIILLFFNLDLFYLVDTETKLFGIIDFDDITFFVSIFIFLLLNVKLKSTKKIKYNYGIWFISLTILLSISSFQSYALYNQGLIRGIQAQKEIFAWSLLYFPIYKMFHLKLVEVEDIKKVLRIFGTIQLILFISQYILTNKITFLYVHTATRYGGIRYYFNPILLDYLLVDKLNNLNNNRKKINSYMYIAIILFETMVVQKFRLTSIALILIIIIYVIVGQGTIFSKIKYFLLGGIFALSIYKTELVQDVLKELLKKNNSFSTLDIRTEARKLYFERLSHHPLVGCGYPVNDYSRYLAGVSKGINLVDNGIFGFLYVYGFLGLIWVISLWLKLLYDGYKLYKEKISIVYLLFPIFFIITSINEIHWFWDSGFCILTMFIIMLNSEIYNICKNDRRYISNEKR